jgi:hypothetical integral membrane protein (TIGR02206 family)
MWRTCHPLEASHILAVLVSAAAWLWMIRSARRARGTPRERRWRRAMASFVLLTNLGWQGYKLTPAGWELHNSLPLHLCDFAWMAAAWSLLGRARLPAVLLYYWGLGLSSQAFITPTVALGPAHPQYWAFWILHWQIVGLPLAHLIAFGLRPTWRDCLAAMAVTGGLFAAVTALNLWLGTNYFFTGDRDAGTATILDALGPWPLRLVWLVLIVAALFALMTLPWIRPSRRQTARN